MKQKKITRKQATEALVTMRTIRDTDRAFARQELVGHMREEDGSVYVELEPGPEQRTKTH